MRLFLLNGGREKLCLPRSILPKDIQNKGKHEDPLPISSRDKTF
jgi:hypothetical protein